MAQDLYCIHSVTVIYDLLGYTLLISDIELHINNEGFFIIVMLLKIVLEGPVYTTLNAELYFMF